MKNPFLVFVVIALNLSDSLSAADRDFADRVAAFDILRKCPFPADFDESKPKPIKSSHFDFAEYFKVFPHLRLLEGKMLDWVYDVNELGGGPILYSRNLNDPGFATVEEFVESIRERAQLDEVERVQEWYHQELLKLSPAGVPEPDPIFDSPASGQDLKRAQDREILEGVLKERMKAFQQRDYWNFWREAVFCDGSDEGFKELAAFYLMADQFFLFWHAKVMERKVYATRAQMIQGLAELPPGFFMDLGEPESTREDAIGLLDPTPSVVRHGERVQVRLLVFEEGQGYVRKVFTFSEEEPHRLLSERDIVEAEYFVTRIF